MSEASDKRRARIIRIGEEAGRIEGYLRTSYLTKLRASSPGEASIPMEASFLIQVIAEFLATERNP